MLEIQPSQGTKIGTLVLFITRIFIILLFMEVSCIVFVSSYTSTKNMEENLLLLYYIRGNDQILVACRRCKLICERIIEYIVVLKIDLQRIRLR